MFRGFKLSRALAKQLVAAAVSVVMWILGQHLAPTVVDRLQPIVIEVVTLIVAAVAAVDLTGLAMANADRDKEIR